MIITKFYNLITEELTAVMVGNPWEEKMQRSDITQNKGYALLVWFLKFYGQIDLYRSFITDGSGDYSCDIIFSNKNIQNEEIFYVIQSKNINLSLNKDNELTRKGGVSSLLRTWPG